MSKPHNNRGIRRLINASIFSKQGFMQCFKHEEAFRQECYLLPIMILLALFLGKSGVEKAFLISVYFLVLLAELLNSAIEATVDRIGSEHHELSGRAKDIGSAAVLLAIINCIMVWLFILLN